MKLSLKNGKKEFCTNKTLLTQKLWYNFCMNKREVINVVTNKLNQMDFSDAIRDIIRSSTNEILQNNKHDFIQKIEAGISNICNEISDNLCNIWNNKNGELTIFPEGTKFFRREEKCSVIVVEQSPKIRTINGLDNLRLRLSFPYVIFIVGFVDGRYNYFSVGLRNKPIISLYDILGRLELPNISAYDICMGDYEHDFENDITVQTNNLISEFWQSAFEFITPLSDFYVKWESNTKSNPLFILQEQFTGLQQLKFFTDRAIDYFDFKNKVRSEINKIQDLIQNNISNLLKIQNNKSDIFENSLKNIVIQSYSELWEYLILRKAKEKQNLNNDYNDIYYTYS